VKKNEEYWRKLKGDPRSNVLRQECQRSPCPN
jgi:hypothetical protein